jgi:hypothetical protein
MKVSPTSELSSTQKEKENEGLRSSKVYSGIKLEFIYHNTPEQNGHVESFYKTLMEGISAVPGFQELLGKRKSRQLRRSEITTRTGFTRHLATRLHTSSSMDGEKSRRESWLR